MKKSYLFSLLNVLRRTSMLTRKVFTAKEVALLYIWIQKSWRNHVPPACYISADLLTNYQNDTRKRQLMGTTIIPNKDFRSYHMKHWRFELSDYQDRLQSQCLLLWHRLYTHFC